MKNNKKMSFESILSDMDIPEERKKENMENALWFIRSGVSINRDHPMILCAIHHAQRIIQ